jgi:O-methyltransferase involved in polyketide biosynthesis
VLAHARALLVNTTPQGVTKYVDADYREPDRIITGAREILDFTQPIAVMFMGVFGYVDHADEAHRIVSHLVDAVPSGSYLALWDSTDTSEIARAGVKAQADLGSPYQLRSVDEIRTWFTGLQLVEPGLVPVTVWRPEAVEVGRNEPIDAYGAVACKP